MSIIFKGNAPDMKDMNIRNVKIYYPSWKAGWENIINSATWITWIPYEEGSEPWKMNISETAPQILASFKTSSLQYHPDTGYDKKECNINISISYRYFVVGGNSPSYKNVKITLELPQGLSLSKDEGKRVLTSEIGTMDSTNGKWDSSYSLYIITDEYVDKFPISVTITADGFETPQIYTFNIEITKLKVNHIKSLLPQNGYQFCDLALIYCEIEFDQNIEDIKEDKFETNK